MVLWSWMWEQQRRADARRYKHSYPRSNDTWTIAEDKRLIRETDRISKLPREDRWDAWQKLTRKMGRSTEALRTRLGALRAGERLAKARQRTP